MVSDDRGYSCNNFHEFVKTFPSFYMATIVDIDVYLPIAIHHHGSPLSAPILADSSYTEKAFTRWGGLGSAIV